MIRPKVSGIFIDIEGLDGSGKTSNLKKALKRFNDQEFHSLKSVGSDSFWGRLARKTGHRKLGTFFFLLEVFVTTWLPIRQALKGGDVVLTDKYFFNVASHVPEVDTLMNRYLVKIFRKAMFEPDLIIYFTVSLEERIRRLKNGPENKFHERLVKNPYWIIERENAYLDIIRRSGCNLIIIDTTNMSIEESGELLHETILNFLFSSAL